jgi:hypothetical protein
MQYPISKPQRLLQSGRFTDGDQGMGVPASICSAEDMNAVYDELLAIITAAGLTPSEVTFNQVLSAINILISNATNGLIDAAPGALDTLNELAAALGNDANFATTMTNALALKADASQILPKSSSINTPDHNVLATSFAVDALRQTHQQILSAQGNQIGDLEQQAANGVTPAQLQFLSAVVTDKCLPGINAMFYGIGTPYWMTSNVNAGLVKISTGRYEITLPAPLNYSIQDKPVWVKPALGSTAWVEAEFTGSNVIEVLCWSGNLPADSAVQVLVVGQGE